MTRCPWARNDTSIAYHDREWGVPLFRDRGLFELLVLEGAQAGLSWDTILAKRARYREVFDGFRAEKVARYDSRKVRALLRDPGIVRNRLKVESTVSNARAFLEVRREHGTFARYLWAFVGGRSIQNRFRTPTDVPAQTDVAVKLSRDLKRRGFRFVGPTIVYAFMQAAGMVNDHLTSCFRHGELREQAGCGSGPREPRPGPS